MDIDFVSVVSALKEIKYSGYFTLEADAYLEKPFNPEELSVRVENLLHQREMLKRKFTDSQDDREIVVADISVSDRDFIERLSSEINDHIAKGKLDYDELASAFFVGKTQLCITSILALTVSKLVN